MRFALEFAVAVIVISPLAGMLAGNVWARANRQTPLGSPCK
jgi:hypothetical protein